MNKQKCDVFNIKLDPYEQEIEDALPESLEGLPVTANLSEGLAMAKEEQLIIYPKTLKLILGLLALMWKGYPIRHLFLVFYISMLPSICQFS
jgi:hypothetical protein